MFDVVLSKIVWPNVQHCMCKYVVFKKFIYFRHYDKNYWTKKNRGKDWEILLGISLIFVITYKMKPTSQNSFILNVNTLYTQMKIKNAESLWTIIELQTALTTTKTQARKYA